MNIVRKFGIPEWAIYYMEYGEDDNLTEEEMDEIDDYMEEEGLYSLVQVSEDKYFCSRPAFGLSTDCYDCWFDAEEGVYSDEDL